MKKQGFIKGSAILLTMVVITKVLGLIYKIPLTNILGGTGMGYFSAVFSVFTPVFALACAGIPSAVARLTAEGAALARYSDLKRLRAAAHICFGLVSLGAFLGVELLALTLGGRLFGEPAVRYALMLLAPSVLFSSAMAVERGYFEGLRNMLPTAFSEITEAALKLVLGLVLAMYASNHAERSYAASGTVFGIACQTAQEASDAALPFITAAAILGSTLASGLACLFMLIFVRVSGDGITPEMLASDPVKDGWKRHFGSLLKLSAGMSVSPFISTLMTMMDMLIMTPCIRLAAQRSPEAFARFTDLGISLKELPHFLYGSYQGLAVLLYGLLPTLTAMFGRSSLAQLTDSYAKGRITAFQRILKRMLRVSAFIAVPGGLSLTLLSGPLLELIFPGKQAEVLAAAPALELLGLASVFTGLTLPCFTVLQALGSPIKAALIMISGGALRLVLELILIPIPTLNVRGAAIAELCSALVICALMLRELRKLTAPGLRLGALMVRPLYAGTVCALSAGLARSILSRRLLVPGAVSTVFAVFAGGIMYFISLLLLCEMPKNLKTPDFLKKI